MGGGEDDGNDSETRVCFEAGISSSSSPEEDFPELLRGTGGRDSSLLRDTKEVEGGTDSLMREGAGALFTELVFWLIGGS